MAEAYAAYYLPANAMKVPLLLEEARAFGVPLAGTPGGPPLRWLDVGAGPGTALWGLAWWCANREVGFEYRGLEQSRQFVELGEGLWSELRRTLGGGTARLEVFEQGGAAAPLLERLRAFDPHVVSLMNSVGEIAANEAARAALIGEVLDRLSAAARSDGGSRWLVLIEPGSKAASRELLRLRDGFLARRELRVWFPCLGARSCGALAREDDWCHEEAPVVFPDWMTALGAEAGLRKEAVLFSYLVVSVGGGAAAGAGFPEAGLRVVSQMMREKGLVQCFLCTSDRGKRRARVLNSRRDSANERFAEAVRGQVFAGVELAEKGDVLGFADCGAPGELDATVFPPLR